MKNILLSLFSCLFTLNLYAQVDLSPAKVKAIKQKIENKIPALKLKLQKFREDTATITFTLDTFRVEQYNNEHLKLVSTDSEMANVTYEQAKNYDVLLNRYYKKLMVILKDDDKKTLMQTQKAWLVFRDNEVKLNNTIEKPAYGGGGTVLALNDSGLYLNLIKTRTLAIFDYYIRITEYH